MSIQDVIDINKIGCMKHVQDRFGGQPVLTCIGEQYPWVCVINYPFINTPTGLLIFPVSMLICILTLNKM
jgi:hypothetical protein